jgi:hypothetical protein
MAVLLEEQTITARRPTGVYVKPLLGAWNVGGTMYLFDAVISEQHTSELTITDSPVETGATISDHAYMLPHHLTIRAGVSDTPMNPNWYNDDGTRNFPASDLFSQGGPWRSVNAWMALTMLQAAAVSFDVQTGLQLYRNMMCTRLDADQDRTKAGVLFFTADLREVMIVSTDTVMVQPRKQKPHMQAAPKKEKGKKNNGDEMPFTGPPLPAQYDQSWALKLMNQFTGSGSGFGVGGS